MEFVVKNFLRCLKPGGTLHIIVPDINDYVKKYIVECKSDKENAADNLITSTILTRKQRGSLIFKIFFINYG